jgi:hypothetical protein
MARQFITKSLSPELIDQAFTVARSGDFGLTLDSWRRYALGLMKHGPKAGGVLIVENRRGTIQAVCSYRIEASLGGGPICSVDHLVALDLVDSGAVTTALLKALEDLARRQSAVALRLDLPYGARATEVLLKRLAEHGHRIECIRLLKPLAGENRPGR